jgi:hypothetical protein
MQSIFSKPEMTIDRPSVGEAIVSWDVGNIPTSQQFEMTIEPPSEHKAIVISISVT